jgi:hypothetical protein
MDSARARLWWGSAMTLRKVEFAVSVRRSRVGNLDPRFYLSLANHISSRLTLLTTVFFDEDKRLCEWRNSSHKCVFITFSSWGNSRVVARQVGYLHTDELWTGACWSMSTALE